jgi:NAD-dependent dihydropyrimidine dehydrogenase PreA subunit
MNSSPWTVFISQAHGHPSDDPLDQEIATRLAEEPCIDLFTIPCIYDLTEQHPAVPFLRSIEGDMLVLSRLYPRAARGILEQLRIRGRFIAVPDSEIGTEENRKTELQAQPNHHASPGAKDPYARTIGLLDLRSFPCAASCVTEALRCIQGHSRHDALSVTAAPGRPDAAIRAPSAPHTADAVHEIQTPARPRWYPVIDQNLCKNCLECLDFCLFGVYDLDDDGHVTVRNPDQCKNGCPACSRVCPAQAILFPTHPDPCISGGERRHTGPAKIDLSQILGGQEPIPQAALDRYQELIGKGQRPQRVDPRPGKPHQRPAGKTPARDELDQLMDDLDELDL